jgi:hypothetical protein
MRKAVFVSMNGYRSVVVEAEDYDLWLRIAERYQLASLREVVLQYRFHPYQITVRKCKSLVLSTLAAQAAASARRKGDADPLDSIEEVTPTVLAELGVSEKTRQAALARYYLTFMRNMHHAGEDTAAFKLLLETLRSSDWKYADNWVMADLRLLAARLYWNQGQFRRSILSALHAIIMRPKVIGRPARPLLRWFRPSEPEHQMVPDYTS